GGAARALPGGGADAGAAHRGAAARGGAAGQRCRAQGAGPLDRRRAGLRAARVLPALRDRGPEGGYGCLRREAPATVEGTVRQGLSCALGAQALRNACAPKAVPRSEADPVTARERCLQLAPETDVLCSRVEARRRAV